MQIRTIEEAVCCKVLDRSELILDIFASRAQTREARLQVEIAQLQYTAPRLRAMWTHLGQVTGGAPMEPPVNRTCKACRLSKLKCDLASVPQRDESEARA